MKASMTQRCYLGWQMYWAQEPWGPWRDNLHIAILARALVGGQGPGSLDRFMVKPPKERVNESESKIFSLLGAVAVPVTREEAEERRRKQSLRAKRRKRGRRDGSS